MGGFLYLGLRGVRDLTIAGVGAKPYRPRLPLRVQSPSSERVELRIEVGARIGYQP